MPTTTQPILIRPASDQDARALARLAAIDSAAPVGPHALVAEVSGVAVAALDLVDGRVIADPFVATADLVDLLRLRAQRLAAPAATHARRGRTPLRRAHRTLVARG
jgi:hypothetical protein